MANLDCPIEITWKLRLFFDQLGCRFKKQKKNFTPFSSVLLSSSRNFSKNNLYVMFNERFVQFQVHVLGTYLPVNWLTKSSSHTSLNLTNSSLVATTLGPSNFG